MNLRPKNLHLMEFKTSLVTSMKLSLSYCNLVDKYPLNNDKM